MVISMKDVEMSIKVIQFLGKAKDWAIWEEKFLAKAKRRGFKDVLLGKVAIPKLTEVLDEQKDTDKLKIKIRDLNDVGYSELILSFADSDAGNVAFQHVRNSKSTDYEDGNIETAWAWLKSKFAPQTAPTEIGLYRKFYDSKLKKGMDPDVWISQMEDMRMHLAKMKSIMTDKHFLMHLINSLTSEYEHIVPLVEKRLDDSVNPLTLEELRAD